MIKYLYLSLLWTGYCSGSISNIYYAGASAGSNDGTSCANAYIYNDGTNGFNAAGKWGSASAQIGSDTVIHLCGTITDSLSGTLLTAHGSGASGNPITIKFEPGASLQSPAESVFINLNSQTWIVIDGGGGNCGYVNNVVVTCANGSIYNTLNGYSGQACPGGACQYDVQTDPIQQAGANTEIKGLMIGPIYIHGGTSDTTFSPPGPGCITNSTASNLNFHNLTLHDAAWCVNAGSSNTTLAYSELYHVDHGFAMGQTSDTPLTISGVTVHDNYMHDFYVWDTTNNSFHHDGIHLFSYCATFVGGHETYCPQTVINGVNVYNNLFGGNWGGNTTANIFFEYNIVGNVFNNVSATTEPSGQQLSNGFFNCAGNITGTNYFNNTALGIGSSQQTAKLLGICEGPNILIENNVATDAAMISTSGPYPNFCPYTLPAGAGGGTQPCINTSYTIKTNAYLAPADFGNGFGYQICTGASCPGNGFLNFSASGFSTFEANAPETGGVFEDTVEPNGTYFNTTTGAEIEGSPTIGAGTNLSTLCTSLSIPGNPCLYDITGYPRGTTWDIGAYNYIPPPGSISSSTGIASSSGVQ